MANNMKFYGTFNGEYQPNSNPILAFTTGDLTGNGWDSDKANNLQSLLNTIKSNIKSGAGKLLIAVPTTGAFNNDFNFFIGRKEDHLAIKIYLPELKAFRATILFFDIEVKETIPTSFGKPHESASYQISTLKVSNVVRVAEHEPEDE